MKCVNGLLRKRYLLTSLLFFCITAIPILSKAQKPASKKEVNIVVSCIESIGNGKLLAHFGYENPNKKTVVVDENGSVVTYNHGQAKKLGLNIFEPGAVEMAFSEEFDAKDRVEWKVTLPNGSVKITTASINSNHCRETSAELNIIPGYYPPEGGKEYNSKIGAELTALYNAYSYDPALPDAPKEIFQLDGNKVLIEVVANEGEYNAMISSLLGIGHPGFVAVTEDPAFFRATGWVEIGDLLLLNDMDALHQARPVYPGVSNYSVPPTGLTRSQGDFAMHSDFARLGYAIDGTGVKIGVLSNSFDTKGMADQNVATGDLPGPENKNGYTTPVDVLLDIELPQGSMSDEGRAMLQIIHDIAPGAELAFRTGFLGEQDMADGIRALAATGEGEGKGNCDIIVDDLSYITEPFFTDGVVSQAINEVVGQGITFFSSAGNFGSSSHTGIFDSHQAPATITGTAHDFSGTGDIFQGVELAEGNYTLVLQWDDGSDPSMNTTDTDLDIFLSDDVGFALLGFNRENVGGFPIEVVPFSVVGESVQANVVIARAAGPNNARVIFKYILFRGGTQFKMLEYGGDGSSTIVGHPNAEGAITVGAVRFDKNPTYNPDYTDPVIMSFSSAGGTPLIGGEPRNKPDFTAPNGVNTTVNLGNGDWDTSDPEDYPIDIDPDTDFPNFFGTSAASPHAAGMAALIIHAKSKFDPGNPLGPEGIRSLMKSTAIDHKEPRTGYNYISGSGFIQAHKALMTFANPTPYVENLILDIAEYVPGVVVEDFSFTVKGDFFTEDTEILIRGEALDDGVAVVDENTITVDHGGFIGNPQVQAFNPVKSPSTLDGGASDAIYFSDPVKQKVVITANSYSKKYGEATPGYDAHIKVETVYDEVLTLDEAVGQGIMLLSEANRLKGLTFAVDADAASPVGQYLIEPSIFPVLDLENPLTEIDNSISEKYTLEFVNGTLTVTKLALKITPENVDMVYGTALPETMAFSYEVADPDVTIDDLTLGLVLDNAEDEHIGTLTNEVALVRGIALVNGIPMIRGIALVNGVTMVRGIALVNGVEVKVEIEGEGMEADTSVYVGGEPLENGTPLVRGIALVNGLPFVNMTEIVRGIALVNGEEVTFEDGLMTALNGDENLVNGSVPAVRGIALVNGEALVGTVKIEVLENGDTKIGNVIASKTGINLVNGIPVVRGIALVNSSMISRGVALVNGEEIVIENGLPTGRGIALVNGIPTIRGIALVNGIPVVRGIALVNELEVHVEDGEIGDVYSSGELVTTLSLIRGIALVNEVALVNGEQLGDSDLALVNGIALTDSDGNGDGDDVVNLANMNFFASSGALANNLKNVRGIALVNGMIGEDGERLKEAAEFIPDDEGLVVQNVALSRGIALVNGVAYVRGVALVNNLPITNGDPIVNGSADEVDRMGGTIMVFDATDVGAPAESIAFSPISFITGTDAGRHWIIPGTFLSNNFDISYGLGTLTIDPAPLSITADAKSKTYGDDDPELSYSPTQLKGGDSYSGELCREDGEDVGVYGILQGSLTPGTNYLVTYIPADLTIEQRPVMVTPIDATYCMREGDPLPEIVFFYDGWISGDPGNDEYTAIRDSDNVPYDQSSDESAGTYTLTPLPDNDNYIFDTELGKLHVNPYGPGTRAVKPVLNCVERTGNRYIANFAYKNDNNVAVCIPEGEDNSLTGSGISWEDGQVLPTLFEPGGGTFYIYFDGSELSWVVNSLDEDHKASNAANANSSSTKCKKNQKSASVSSIIEEKELDPDYLNVYPNPVTDKVHITMKDIEHYKMIQLYDITGRKHSITSIDKRSDNLEIDMAHLSAGYYIFKIVMEDSSRVVQVIKE